MGPRALVRACLRDGKLVLEHAHCRTTLVCKGIGKKIVYEMHGKHACDVFSYKNPNSSISILSLPLYMQWKKVH